MIKPADLADGDVSLALERVRREVTHHRIPR
jgi:hypothetical protein